MMIDIALQLLLHQLRNYIYLFNDDRHSTSTFTAPAEEYTYLFNDDRHNTSTFIAPDEEYTYLFNDDRHSTSTFIAPVEEHIYLFIDALNTFFIKRYIHVRIVFSH